MSKNAKSFCFNSTEIEYPLIISIFFLVRQAKILGVTVSDDLRWSTHVLNIIKKANKRIFFIVQLKGAKIPAKEILNFYCCCVRPVLEYACEVFHFALPKYLSDNIERVQTTGRSVLTSP
jgi:hypothetical protein